MDVRKDRDKYIGGSDVPIIMGLSPFKTRWELLLEKALLKENDFDGNEYTRYGELMEPKIRDYVNEYALTNYQPDMRIDGIKRYHADGYEDGSVLEIKTTSQVHENVYDYMSYMVQLQLGMEVFGVTDGLLAVYKRPDDFCEDVDPWNIQLFKVERDDALLADINKAIDAFERDLEWLKENPLSTENELPSRVDIVPLAEKAVALESKIVEMKKIESDLKELKAVLKDMMMKYSVDKITMPNGTKITLVKGVPDKVVDKFNEDRFREQNPSIWETYLEPTVKKGRDRYVRITP